MRSLLSRIELVVVFTISFFPLVVILDSISKPFYVAFIEELFGKTVPLLLTFLILHPLDSWVDNGVVGIICGMTFGYLEIFTKTLILGFFSPLMLLPFSFVHCVNGMVDGVLIGEGIKRKWWSLIPLAYILTSFHHMTWNTLVGFM